MQQDEECRDTPQTQRRFKSNYLFVKNMKKAYVFFRDTVLRENLLKTSAIFLCTLCSYSLYAQQPGNGNIIYVNKSVNTTATGYSGDGSSWNNAIPELGDALKWARQQQSSGSPVWGTGNLQIWVAKGTYFPLYSPADNAYTTDSGRSNAFVLIKNVQIYGGFAGTESTLSLRDWENNVTTLSGNVGDPNSDEDNNHNVVVAIGDNGTASLDGFTVTKGASKLDDYTTYTAFNEFIYGIQSGAGIYIKNGKLTLKNLNIKDNFAYASGGGIFVNEGTVSIEKVNFNNNLAKENGGAINISNGNVTVLNSSVLNNKANSGGGFYTSDWSPVNLQIINTKIANNEGTYQGGGIWGYPYGGNFELIGSIVENNKSASGAGIFISGGNFKSINNTVVNNTLSSETGTGAGLFIQYTKENQSVSNSVFWGNSTNLSSDIQGALGSTNFQNNIIKGSGGSSDWVLGGVDKGLNLDLDPLFASNSDFTATQCSPLVDGGNNTLFTDLNGNTVDFANNDRVYNYANNGTIDIGAFEYGAEAIINSKDVVFNSLEADYNGQVHNVVASNLPNGITVNYTLTDQNGNTVTGNGTKDSGIYQVKATLSSSLGCSVNLYAGLVVKSTIKASSNKILYVNKNVDKTSISYYPSGESWANALPELSDALKWARELKVAGDTDSLQIWVAKGTYKPFYNATQESFTTNGKRSNAFVMVKGVSLIGGFAGTETDSTTRNWVTNPTILSGNINNQDTNTDNVQSVVFAVGDLGNAVLDGFTIRDGYTSSSDAFVSVQIGEEYVFDNKNGAGLHILNTTTDFTNLNIENNQAAANGGGVYNYGNTGGLTNVKVHHNTALQNGGGIYSDSKLTVFNSSVTNNTGGGIYAVDYEDKTHALSSVEVAFNTNTNDGGGVSIIGKANILNVNIHNNSSNKKGGGLFYAGTELNIHNTTVVSNTVSNDLGAGVYISKNNTGEAVVQNIFNSVFYKNLKNGTVDNINGEVKELKLTNSLLQGTGGSNIWKSDIKDGGNNIDVNPLFLDESNQNYTASANSPLIDAGDNALYADLVSASIDAMGNQRVYNFAGNGKIDLGAYEYSGVSAFDISGVIFDNKEVDYNGQTHNVESTNLPSGTNVSYTITNQKEQTENGNSAKDAGIYSVKALLSSNGVQREINAKLTINHTLKPTNNVLFVNKNVNKTTANYIPDGSSWANAVEDISDVLVWSKKQSKTGTPAWGTDSLQVWVAKGTYHPLFDAMDNKDGVNGGRRNAFVLVKDVQLYGGFAGTETSLDNRNFEENPTVLSGNIGDQTIDTDNTYSVVISSGDVGNALLDGFTVTKAYSVENETGGVEYQINDNDHFGHSAIYITQSSLKLQNVEVLENYAYNNGAGIYILGYATEEAQPTIEIKTSKINKNISGSSGGGIYNRYANLNINDSEIIENSLTPNRNGVSGGGVQSQGATKIYNTKVLNNTIYNSSTGAGVAISGAFDAEGILVEGNKILTVEGQSYNNAYGAGIYLGMGDYATSIRNSVFKDNVSPGHGAGLNVYGLSSTLAEFSNLTFDNNKADVLGGGFNIQQYSGGINLINSKFYNNSGNNGGALANGGTLRLENVEFKENTANNSGGGLYNLNTGTLNAFGLLIHNNKATTSGGGITNAGTLTATNLTIAKNNSASGGGVSLGQNANVNNSIIWGNTATDGKNNFTNGGLNVKFTNSLIGESLDSAGDWTLFATDGGNNLDTDPLFKDVANGDFSLVRCSPAVNVGDNALFAGLTGANLDFAGNPRVFSNTIDLGAYELQQLPLDLSNVTFADKEVVENGQPQSIIVEGLPEDDLLVTYTITDADNNTTAGNSAILSGIYTVKATVSAPGGICSVILTATLTIKENLATSDLSKKDNLIKVVPNPVQNGQNLNVFLTLPSSELANATLRIFDLNGRFIKEIKVSNQDKIQIPIQLLASTYLIQVSTGNHSQTIKFIVR